MPMATIFDEWLIDADPDSPIMKKLFCHLVNNDLDTMVSYGGLLTHQDMDQMISFAEIRKKQQDDKLLLKDLLSQVSTIQQCKLDYDSIYQKIADLDIKNLNDKIYCIDTLPNISMPYSLSDYLSSSISIRDIVSNGLKFDTTKYHINDDWPSLWHYIKTVADEIKEKIYDKQQRSTKYDERYRHI